MLLFSDMLDPFIGLPYNSGVDLFYLLLFSSTVNSSCCSPSALHQQGLLFGSMVDSFILLLFNSTLVPFVWLLFSSRVDFFYLLLFSSKDSPAALQQHA